mgnify:FL=1
MIEDLLLEVEDALFIKNMWKERLGLMHHLTDIHGQDRLKDMVKCQAKMVEQVVRLDYKFTTRGRG